MKVCELIEHLMKCPMDAEVNIAVNSAACGQVEAIRAKEDEVWIATWPSDIKKSDGEVVWENEDKL